MSSDEEDDITQLQAVEHKLLTHDPNFGIDQTHAALSSQRSAFMSAFRPQYVDGDVAGMLACPLLSMPGTPMIRRITALHHRSRTDPPEHRTVARVRDVVRAKHGRRRQRGARRSFADRPRFFSPGRPRASR